MNRTKRSILYRGFKRFIQLWAITSKGLIYLTYEEWHYIEPRIDTRKSQCNVVPNFQRKATKRGRHYDRPLRTGRWY